MLLCTTDYCIAVRLFVKFEHLCLHTLYASLFITHNTNQFILSAFARRRF